MNTRFEKSTKFRIGIIFHGNKIWLSELLSYVLTLALIVILFTLSILTLLNEFRQHRLANAIRALESEMVHVENDLQIAQNKRNIRKILLKYAFPKVSLKTISSLTDVIYSNSRQYGYDPLLLLAVIKVESIFNPDAKGQFRSGTYSGAFGLMQLKFATAQETATMLDMKTLTKEDLMKPDINLILGTAYLTKCISSFKSFKLGIIAYNIGPEKVRSTMRKNEILPLNYFSKVINAYYALRTFIENYYEDESGYN